MNAIDDMNKSFLMYKLIQCHDQTKNDVNETNIPIYMHRKFFFVNWKLLSSNFVEKTRKMWKAIIIKHFGFVNWKFGSCKPGFWVM